MTEKNYNQQQQTMKTMQKQQTAAELKAETAPVKVEDKKEETGVDGKKEKKIEKKVIRKDEAVVNGVSLPVSTKTSIAICKFIRGKTIEKAVADLEEVLKFNRVIPMTGEIPHKKGKGIMSGRYPIKAIGYFIRMLKNLNANAIVNGLEEPIIVEAIPNRASRPYGRFGAIRRKRTHIKIKVIEKKIKEKK